MDVSCVVLRMPALLQSVLGVSSATCLFVLSDDSIVLLDVPGLPTLAISQSPLLSMVLDMGLLIWGRTSNTGQRYCSW